jgi:hypothetical protein
MRNNRLLSASASAWRSLAMGKHLPSAPALALLASEAYSTVRSMFIRSQRPWNPHRFPTESVFTQPRVVSFHELPSIMSGLGWMAILYGIPKWFDSWDRHMLQYCSYCTPPTITSVFDAPFGYCVVILKQNFLHYMCKMR